MRGRLALCAAVAGAAALATAGGAGAAPSLDSARLGPDGLGPVRIGMTVPQARAATSSRLRITQRNGACAVLEKVGLYDGIYFILTGGVIRRASVESTLSVNWYTRTTRGIRLASSERRVRRAYGRPFFVARDANSGGLELLYRPKPSVAPARRIAFVTAPLDPLIPGRYVREMSVGDVPEVRYSEACS
jgi:hypothetical protein